MNLVTGLIAFSLLSTPALAGTITVGLPGSGANFNQLRTAVALSAPGDTILVSAGTFNEATIVIDKPLSIIGAGSGQTELLVSFQFSIEHSALGEATLVSGFSIGRPNPGAMFPQPIQIQNCQGSVLLQDIGRAFSTTGELALPYLEVQSSDMVIIESSNFGGNPNGGNCGTQMGPGDPPISAFASTIFLSDCSLIAGPMTDPCFVQPGYGGIMLEDSTAFIGDSFLQGSLGNSNLSGWTEGHPAAGLSGTSQLHLFGATAMKGGYGGLDPLVLGDSYGGPALILTPGDVVTATPEVTFLAGHDWNFTTSVPTIQNSGGSLTTSSERWTTLSTGVQSVGLGGSVTLSMEGEPGSVVMPFLAFRMGSAPIELPGVEGAILIDVIGAKALPNRVLDLTGSNSLTFPVPAVPALVGASFPFQSLGVHQSGLFSLSNVSSLSVL